MDPIVAAALRKWPDVPHCHGWLALDARGAWYLRDDRVQAAGPFPRVKGSRVDHEKLLGFIERNYAADADGAWYFQNGPQRVYVELEAAPFVWRLDAATGVVKPPAVHAHTGAAAVAHEAWQDEDGRLFLLTDLGFGLVHSMDTGLAAAAIEAGWWPPRTLPFAEMPRRFGYRLRPQSGHPPSRPSA
jgi:hypothetical protein